MSPSAREYLLCLIHKYFGVDCDIVWDVVMNKIPALDAEVRKILQQE